MQLLGSSSQQFAFFKQLQQPCSVPASESPPQESHASRGLKRIQISLLDLKKKSIHVNEKHFHLIKYPLTDRFADFLLICWRWWIPWPNPLLEMIQSIVSENCFDESQVCQFDCNRNFCEKVSYDCAGLLRLHECSFYSSHVIQVLRIESSMRNMGMIY